MSFYRIVPTVLSLIALMATGVSQRTHAQSDQYKRAKPKPAEPPAAPAVPGSKATPSASATPTAPSPAVDDKSDKLDISELEQKYWAPKDTDFTVVQNRTYTKAKRYAVSAMAGPSVNDTFNEGFNYGVRGNYYFDERYGVEVTYLKSDLSDNDVTKDFANFSLGGIRPDFNRDDEYMGIGFNWIPIYAKVSLLGKRILYFDLQITPHIGMASYLQQARDTTGQSNNRESAFAYGVDVTQYFFVSREFALRFDLHNRWYSQDVLNWNNGTVNRTKSNQTTNFLIGLTYFF
jgi:outer membrane beta-barrel protein